MWSRKCLMFLLMFVFLNLSYASELEIFDSMTNAPPNESSVSLIEALEEGLDITGTSSPVEPEVIECIPPKELEIIELLTSSIHEPELAERSAPRVSEDIECKTPYYDIEDEVLYIPCINISDGQGGKLTFKSSWTIIPDRETLSVEIKDVELIE